jgi:transcriptional regulator with XRE-family HTH domain
MTSQAIAERKRLLSENADLRALNVKLRSERIIKRITLKSGYPTADEIAFITKACEASANGIPEKMREAMKHNGMNPTKAYESVTGKNITHDELRAWRVRQGISQDEMAGLANISRATYSAIETSQGGVSTSILLTIELIAGIDPELWGSLCPENLYLRVDDPEPVQADNPKKNQKNIELALKIEEIMQSEKSTFEVAAVKAEKYLRRGNRK